MRYVCLALAVAMMLPAATAAQWSSPGKPGAPVAVDAPTVRVAVGESTQFNLTIITTSTVDAVAIEALPSPGLARVLIGDLAQAPTVAAPATVPVSLRGLEDGRHYLNVLVTTERAGQQSMRSFALPVLVGSGQWLNQSKAQPSAQGQAVLSLPAKETIR